MAVHDSELAERVAVYALQPGFHIAELRMGPGQRVPWHYHSRTHDSPYVLEGRLRICLHDPEDDGDHR
jgi:quercetin dioxygenase-like cupin family protein